MIMEQIKQLLIDTNSTYTIHSFKELENLVISLKNDLNQTKADNKIDSDVNINIMKNNLNKASNKLDTVKNYNNNF